MPPRSRSTSTTPLAVLPELLAAPSYGVDGRRPGRRRPRRTSTCPALGGALGRGRRQHASSWPAATGTTVTSTASSCAPTTTPAAAYDAFEDGDVDWAPVPGERFGARGRGTTATTTSRPSRPSCSSGSAATPRASDRPAFRQAIAAAIDREAIVRGRLPRPGRPARLGRARRRAGHGPEGCADCAHDPVRARRLLVEAFPDGDIPTVAIDFDASPAQEAMAKIVGRQPGRRRHPDRRCGRCRWRTTSASSCRAASSSSASGGSAPTGRPTPTWRRCSARPRTTTSWRSGRPTSTTCWARPRPGGPAARAERWAQAQRIVLDAAVVVPIAQFRTQVVVADRVRGLVHAVDGTVDWPDAGHWLRATA